MARRTKTGRRIEVMCMIGIGAVVFLISIGSISLIVGIILAIIFVVLDLLLTIYDF